MERLTHILTRMLVLLVILQGPMARAMLCVDASMSQTRMSHPSGLTEVDPAIDARHEQNGQQDGDGPVKGHCHQAPVAAADVQAPDPVRLPANQAGDCCDAGCLCAMTPGALVDKVFLISSNHFQPAAEARIGESQSRISVTSRPPIQ